MNECVQMSVLWWLVDMVLVIGWLGNVGLLSLGLRLGDLLARLTVSGWPPRDKSVVYQLTP